MTRAGRGFMKAITDLQMALSRVDAASMLIGGVAVIARGVPRTTLDVDATIDASGVELAQLLGELGRGGVVPRIDDAIGFARTSQVLLLRHTSSGTPVDPSLAWLPFEREALRRSAVVSIGRTKVRVPRVEDLVLYKLIAARPKDLDNAEQLLAIHRVRVDLPGVRARLAEFCAVLEDDQRLKSFDALLTRRPVGVSKNLLIDGPDV